MQNIVINICKKFHNDRLKNDGALGDRKSHNYKHRNNKNNNVGGHWEPFPGPKIQQMNAIVKVQ